MMICYTLPICLQTLNVMLNKQVFRSIADAVPDSNK